MWNIDKYRKISLATELVCCVLLVFLLLLQFLPERDARSEDKLILRYGDVNPEGNITVKTARYFADRVNVLSEGRIEVDVYSSGVLGDELQSYQQLRMGALDFYRANAASLNALGDMKANLLSLPYLFRSREHMWRVLNGDPGEEILQDIQRSGSQMLGLYYVDEGERNLFMTEDSVRSLEDLQGKRIRSMVSETLSETLSALGAVPVQLTYAETYNALKRGEVDGAENPVFSYYSNKFYQAAPYYIKSGHMYSPGIVVMSEITWDSLTAEERELIQEAAEQAETYSRENTEQEECEIYERLRSLGVELRMLSDKEAWKERAVSIYPAFTRGKETLLRKIQELQ